MSDRLSTAPAGDPNVARLQRAVVALEKMQARLDAAERAATEPIAIIGMSCRFPGGASDPEAFWRMLCAGEDGITEVPPDRWDVEAHYDPDPSAPGKMYTRWGGFLQDWTPAAFDARFFGIAPREAEGIDPQHRLLLEVAHEALERAGQTTARLSGSATGVFVGVMTADYAALHLKTGEPSRLDAYYALGNEPSFVAGRLSYLLGLQGPSMALNTACSSSLVALDVAAQNLRNRRCDLALAGGVNLMLSPDVTIASCRIRSQSPRGRCRTFDASADGYVRSEGCGIVVLKRLSDALADGDPVLACLRGSATNHDGPSGGLTVPNGPAQEKLLRAALTDARATPADVLYVEAHGTGTPLGDPIEARALGAVLGRTRNPAAPLAVGSVKTNIGHTEAAAGIAGVIKAILVLQHRQIPPHRGLEQLSAHVPWDELRLTVPTRLTPLPPAERPIVGVSSFGLSGINAHVLLEAAPPSAPAASTASAVQLLPLSARSPEALRALAQAHRRFLTGAPATLSMRDVAYTAGARRLHHEHRLAVVAGTREDAVARLDSFLRNEPCDGLVTAPPRTGAAPKLTFVFSGQGSQWLGMGRSLLDTEPAFRHALERCHRALVACSGPAVLDALESGDAATLDGVDIVQPVLFSIQVALTALLQSWGVEPDAVIGHSMGEVAAAHVAGALSLDDAARVIAVRSRLLARLDGQGAMAVVDLPLSQAQQALAGHDSRLSIAAVNGPRSVVLSGDPAALAAVCRLLEQDGVFCRTIHVGVAAHSPQVDGLCPELLHTLADLAPRPVHLPFVSTVYGAPLDGTTCDARYWARNLREPVRFADAIDTLAAQDRDLFLEVSPHPVLLPALERGVRIASLRRDVDGRAALLASLASLYVEGYPIAFDRVAPAGSRTAVLPTYPWQRERFWSMDATPADVAAPGSIAPATSETAGGTPSHFYDALARSRGAAVEESYLTFGLFPARVDGFSWLRAALGVDVSDAQARLLQDGQRSLRRAVFDSVDFSRVGSVLDFGCGYGSDLLALAERYPHLQLHGYTISAEQSAIAARRFDARGLSARVRVYHRDSSVTAFPGRYDLVFGFEVATHVRDKAALFANIDAHLAPSGYLLLADFVAGTASGIDIADTASYNAGPELWLALLSEHHLRIVECVDVSPEVARFLDDPDFAANLARVDAAVGLTAIERRNFEAMANFGTALDRQLIRYVLFIVQKDELARPAYLRDLNRRWLEHPVRYADRAPAPGREAPSDDWLYRIEWRRTPPPSPAGVDGSVLIFDDPHGVGSHLADHLHHAGVRAVRVRPGEAYGTEGGDRYVVRPAHADDIARLVREIAASGVPLRHVVHLWSLGVAPVDAVTPAALREAERLGCAGMLPSIATLCRTDAATRVWIVTRGALAITDGAPVPGALAAPLWGLARTLAIESPSIWGGILDLDPREAPAAAARQIASGIAGADGEDQVAYRDGTRLVARLVRCPAFASRALTFHSDGTYIITGGLGDLGFAAARRFAERGARHLALLGRSAAAGRRTQELESLGVRVHVAAVDVADEAAMRALLARLADEGWPAVRGVVHAAGVVHQAPLQDVTIEALTGDARPKIDGTIVLDRVLAGVPLDFFVLFSSGSAILGSPTLGGYAAANAFQDAFAHHRVARGLPALSIGWGFWAEGGMAAREGGIVPRGMEALSPDEGLAVMERLLGQDGAQAGVLRMDPEVFCRFHPEYARLPLMRELTGGSTRAPRRDARPAPDVAPPRSTPGIRAALAEAGAGFRRRSMMEDYLKAQLAWVLKARAADITAHAPMQTFGLDSLMAVELRNRLERDLGLTLSATLAFVHPTLSALATHLGGELALPLDAPATSSDMRSTDEIADRLAAALAGLQGGGT